MTARTVRELTHRVLQAAGVSTIFGNPGSNELPFLVDLPDGMRYVLGLHEGVVVGMADGFAQASGGVGFVNLHAASGTGNAMGALTNAAISRSRVVVLAGQQVRSTVGQHVMLANSDASLLTRPLTGFSAEPLSAGDVPRTIAQALHESTTARGGPSYVSVPYDDWDQPTEPGGDLLLARVVVRSAHAHPDEVAALARRLGEAVAPLLVLGSDLDGPVPMDDLVALAEHLEAPVWAAPSLYRLPFPNRHPLFRGVLPAGVRSIRDAFEGHDLVVVLGAPVFRYHQYEPGDFLPEGTRVVQVTDDAAAAARAPFGDAVVADPASVVAGLLAALGVGEMTEVAGRSVAGRSTDGGAGSSVRYRACDQPREGHSGLLHPAEVFAALRRTQPEDTAYVVESTSTNADFWAQMDLRHPGSYYFPASGGLGFGMPAAIGVALAVPSRRVVAVIGDGSASYGITALWTAAQLRVPVTFVILRNGTYGALRWFAELLQTPDVPGIDIPDIDYVPIAEGYGVPGTHVTDLGSLERLLTTEPKGPRLVQVDTALTTPH